MKRLKRLRLIDWLFLLGLFLFFLLPATDPDLGWHLRCGEMIWKRQNWCQTNQFSVLLEGYRWSYPSWLYQVTIYLLYKFFGLWGLSVLGALVTSLTFFFWYLAIPRFSWGKMIAIGLTIFFSWGVFSFGIRSQLLGFLFFNLLLWLWSWSRQKQKLVFLIPVVFLLWANSHGSVVLGLGLLAGLIIMGLVKRKEKKHSLILILVFLLAFGATLLNPFGWRIYQEAWRHFGPSAGGVDLSKIIAEWVPPNRDIWRLVLISGFGSFIYLMINGFVGDTSESFVSAFLILPFVFLALKTRRHLPFYFSLGFYFILMAESTKRTLFCWLHRWDSERKILTFLTVSLLIFVSFFIRLPSTVKINSSWDHYCQQLPVGCPQKAVEFLKTQKQGYIFNRYEWGGFLIWQLPDFKIFVDGRMPTWTVRRIRQSGGGGGPVSPYTIYLETLQVRPGWQKILSDHDIEWIFISPGTFMDLKLAPGPEEFGWKEAYRDKTAVIFKKL